MSKKLEVKAVPTNEVGLDATVFTKAEYEHWSENPPSAIVFASSSLRKAILLAVALSEFNTSAIQTVPFLEHMPFDPSKARTPLEFQQQLEYHVPNGDGELKEAIFVGVFQGVPVYMVPQEGETDRNDAPLHQSENKVEDVRKRLQDKDVLIFGSDSTGLINGVHLGKPRNHIDAIDGFPAGFQSVDQSDPLQVEAFKRAYLKNFYSSDTSLVHNNALFASRGENQDFTATRETRLELVIRNVQERLAELQVFLESAGGGMFQQFFDLLGDIEDQLSDILMREAIAQLPAEQRPWAVIAHIMGMPAWALPGVIEELIREYVRDASVEI